MLCYLASAYPDGLKRPAQAAARQRARRGWRLLLRQVPELADNALRQQFIFVAIPFPVKRAFWELKLLYRKAQIIFK